MKSLGFPEAFAVEGFQKVQSCVYVLLAAHARPI